MKTRVRRKNKLHVLEIALLVGLAVFLASGTLALQTQDQLAEKVVRLHVLANSDSREDQALKLLVRDAVLEEATAILDTAADRREAEARLRGQLLELERIAAETVAQQGYHYPVTLELADTEFPTKEYDRFTLPAGEYLALRVLIGDAEGQNWWCVVFPPLCTAVSTEVPVAALTTGLDARQVSLITEEHTGYVLKLKSVEFWEQLRQKWK